MFASARVIVPFRFGSVVPSAFSPLFHQVLVLVSLPASKP